MLRTFHNTTDITQMIIDGRGEPHEVAAGDSLEYLDNDSYPGSVDGLIVKTEISSGVISYIGYAHPGTGEDQPGWMIKKKGSAGGVESWTMAGGQFVIQYKWTQRTSYDYS